jgi:hypothetical protein
MKYSYLLLFTLLAASCTTLRTAKVGIVNSKLFSKKKLSDTTHVVIIDSLPQANIIPRDTIVNLDSIATSAINITPVQDSLSGAQVIIDSAATSRQAPLDSAIINSKDSTSIYNKVRVVTINKLTKDTIVEWVDPININELDVVRIQDKNKPIAKLLPTKVILKQVDSSYIYKPHKAMLYHQGNNTSYYMQNDTLLITAPDSNILAFIQRINTTAPALSKSTKGSKPQRTKRLNNKNTKPTVSNIVKPNKPIVVAPPDTVTPNTELSNTIDSNLLDIENTAPITIDKVGDAWYDGDPEAIIVQDITQLQQKIIQPIINWQTFKAKTKLHIEGNNKSQTANLLIRMKQNEVTWASITVLIVGEVYRAIINADSTKAIDKLKDKYYLYGNDAIEELLGLPLQQADLQSILIGNKPLPQATLILAKQSNSGIAIALQQQTIKATIVYNNDSTIKSIIIRGTTTKGPFVFKCNYENYETTINGKLSTKRTMQIFANKQSTLVELDFIKYTFDEDIEVPFTIPTKFTSGQSTSPK